ncbi:MAG: hypothetical protein HY877_01160 [Deltaproteobacteria bacterium]|nr:hypothetical protein [Deltaproteobacteria bacterium]
MFKKIVYVFLILFSSTNLLALDLPPNFVLQGGQSKLSVGGNILWGVLSPQAHFTTNPTLNRARLYEENIRYARGIGHGMLKDMYMEVEAKIFQARQETVSGTLVHAANKGSAMIAKSGGHFVHTNNFALGGWIQTGSPLIMNRSKFVNPVVDYVGGGLNTITKFTSVIGMTNSVYVGSGIFMPRKRNPHAQGTTFFSLNFNSLTKGRQDFILQAGGMVDYDLASRIDASYQASPLGDGRIKHMAFLTPFTIDIPLGTTWRLDGGYAKQWFGRSVRGSQFATFNLSKIF